MSWTEEKVEKLRELWGKGNTASQIAEIIVGGALIILTIAIHSSLSLKKT